MLLNDAIKQVVEKNVPSQYQPFITAQLTAVADDLLTPEMAAHLIKKIVDAMSVSDLALTYSLVAEFKTTEELVNDTDATLQELDRLNRGELAARAAASAWLTNFLTGLLLISITIAKGI